MWVGIGFQYTNVAPGMPLNFNAQINGRASLIVWEFGDGTFLTNRTSVTHAWDAPGQYTLVLHAYNATGAYPCCGWAAWLTIQIVSAVHYVSAASAAPAVPYASWNTAAHTIQEAVDAVTMLGARVLVTNGVYATGGRAIYGLLTNRVALTKPVVLQSVNGPEVTVILGTQVPGTTNGDGATRCVYMTNLAVLSGFTLASGATRASGDTANEQSGGGLWCESLNALVTNCSLTCNWAAAAGGGAYGGTLQNCILTGNWSPSGGGAAGNGLRNNCLFTANSSTGAGGGPYGDTLNNCTLTGNWSGGGGGGAAICTLSNCILYYNTAATEPNYTGGTLSYCCTVPIPGSGAGNISADPQMASASHLSANSPCRGAGSPASATGLDLDGESWLNPPSIGCDEYHPESMTGPLTVAVAASWTNVAVGFAVDLTASISGRVARSVWDFGDGTGLSNRTFASHAWSTSGDHAVILRAYNESYPAGVSATGTVRVLTKPVHYVSAASTNPVPPYTAWNTAAQSIQGAVDATTLPGALVLVGSGLYNNGGRVVYGSMTNRVAVSKPVTVQSVNGPAVTVICGYQVPGTTNGDAAVRCVYLTNGAGLAGFTLSNGAVRASLSGTDEAKERSGGGVWCESANSIVSNCVLTLNAARSYGAGAYQGTLKNCILVGNAASAGGGASAAVLHNCALWANQADNGGGAYSCILSNCTLTGNTANGGGGVQASTLANSIVTGNSASAGSNYTSDSQFNYCCTTPLPTAGPGNFTNDPLFMSLATGNLHLQPTSPCINHGNNTCAPGSCDLDGLPRIADGVVDVGAYEYQSQSSFQVWLYQHGLLTDGSADSADPDRDGLNNWQEWVAGTDPTNAVSVLRVAPLTGSVSGMVVSWLSATNHIYSVERSTNLGAHPPFQVLATGIPGQAGTTTFTDTNAPAPGPVFYRVSVSLSP